MSINPTAWAGEPDPEPTSSVSGLIADLGVSDAELPAISMDDFLKKFGLTGNDLGDGEPGPPAIVPVV